MNIVTCAQEITDLERTPPTGAGMCMWVALAKDNPNYNLDAAPPLKHTLFALGPAC